MHIPLPKSPKAVLLEKNQGVFEIEGLYPGYGITLGNALRRVLLSSLPGAAVTSFRMQGVSHEFSAIPGVLEDVIEITLNLKKLRMKLFSDESQKLTLKAKGEKLVRAGGIEKNPQVEIVNPDLHIATLTAGNTDFEMELTIERGIGYAPVEVRKKEKLPIGVVAVDAIFSPVKKVNFEVENMRVGDRTDFNRLRLHIETDGTIDPQDALAQAAQILLDLFSVVRGSEDSHTVEDEMEAQGESTDVNKIAVEELNLSRRTVNALVAGGVKTVGGLTRHRTSELKKMKGLGAKGITEIEKALKKHGLEIKE